MQPLSPYWTTGRIAHGPGDAAFPELWEGLFSLWCMRLRRGQTKVLDLSGRRHDPRPATLTAGASWVHHPSGGTAVNLVSSFGGTDYLAFDNSDGLYNFTNSEALAVWGDFVADSNTNTPLWSIYSGVVLWIDSGGVPYLQCKTGGVETSNCIGSTGVGAGGPNRRSIGCSFNRIDEEAAIYLDGVDDTASSAFGSHTYIGPGQIGVGNTAGNGFDGRIFNVILWKDSTRRAAKSADVFHRLHHDPLYHPLTRRVMPTVFDFGAAGAGGTSEVTTSSQYIWNTLQAISDSLQAIWNVNTSVSQTGQLIWDVRDAVSQSGQFVWDVREALSQSEQYIWNVREAVSNSSQSIYDVLQVAENSSQYVWDVREAVSNSVQTIWDVLSTSSVNTNLQFIWDVLAATSNSNSFPWNVREAISQSEQVIWNTRAAVSDSVQAIYDIREIAQTSSQHVWNVLEAVSNSNQLIWDVLSTSSVNTNLQFVWNVLAATSNTLSPVWNVREAISTSEQCLWNVLTDIEKSSQYIWNVREAVQQSRQHLWNVRKATSTSSSLIWHIRAAVGTDNQFLWNTLRTITSPAEIQLLWDVREAISQSRQAIWNVRSLTTAQKQFLWDVIVNVEVLQIYSFDLYIQQLEAFTQYIKRIQDS